MAWVRTEEGAPLHPKFFRAGVMAYGYWHACLSYCNRYLTDGYIPGRDLPLIFPGTVPNHVVELTEILVREGLLDVVREGYSMHDYGHYQPLKKEVLRQSRSRSARGRQAGLKSGISRRRFASTPVEPSGSNQTNPVPYRTEPDRTVPETTNGISHFAIPGTISEALNQCPTLGGVQKLRSPDFWQAEVRANATVNIGQCLLDAEAWLRAKGARKQNYASFIHNWLKNQQERV